MIALRGAIHVACFIIHVYTRAFGDALQKTWMSWNTPLFFSAREMLAVVVRGKGERDDEKMFGTRSDYHLRC